jgi:hypothetical protein
MTALFLIIVIFITVARAEINTTAVLSLILEQQAAESVAVEAEDLLYWQNATLMMAYLNAALNITATNVLTLYDNVSQPIIFGALNTAECVVSDESTYQIQAVPAEEFLCCHLRKLTPLMHMNALAAQVLTGLAGTQDSENVAAALQGLGDMKLLEAAGFIIARCLDDTAAFVPQQATAARAIPTLVIGSFILQAYLTTETNALSLQGRGAPISLGSTPTNFTYYLGDAAYQAQCGAAPMAALLNAQIASACEPISL